MSELHRTLDRPLEQHEILVLQIKYRELNFKAYHIDNFKAIMWY